MLAGYLSSLDRLPVPWSRARYPWELTEAIEQLVGADPTVDETAEVAASAILDGHRHRPPRLCGQLGPRLGGQHRGGRRVGQPLDERGGEEVRVRCDGRLLDTGVRKFGALVADGVCIGANAVTSPGTLLPPGAIVPRLGLVAQT